MRIEPPGTMVMVVAGRLLLRCWWWRRCLFVVVVAVMASGWRRRTFNNGRAPLSLPPLLHSLRVFHRRRQSHSRQTPPTTDSFEWIRIAKSRKRNTLSLPPPCHPHCEMGYVILIYSYDLCFLDQWCLFYFFIFFLLWLLNARTCQTVIEIIFTRSCWLFLARYF